MPVLITRAYLEFDRRAGPLIDVGEAVHIPDGFSLLVAPSGGGKTSLLRLASGWYEKGAGTPAAFALEADYDPLGDVQFIGNHQTLLPWYTIRGNIALRGGAPAEAQRFWEALALPSVSFDRYPYELSLGMYKRAELAAALSCSFRFLLLDEFFSSLDPEARRVSVALLEEMTFVDRAILITTHNPEGFPQVERIFSLEQDEKGGVRRMAVRS